MYLYSGSVLFTYPSSFEKADTSTDIQIQRDGELSTKYTEFSTKQRKSHIFHFHKKI